MLGAISCGGAAAHAASSGAPSSGAPSAHAGSTRPVSTCPHPSYVTSQPFGGHYFGRYYVYNNMWNAAGYTVRQTLFACSYRNWYVVATMNNQSGDGAVKTYPNVQENFSSIPISSFTEVRSSFAESDPHVGIYEDAYDMWLNGIASSGSTEVMIWNENHDQVPGGSPAGSVTLGGRFYTVWSSGTYFAFVASKFFTSGTLNLLSFYDYLISKHWIRADSVLDQIDYGVELVSTNNHPERFSFTNFGITTERAS